MNKIISILILSIFLYNTVGFISIYPFLNLYFKYLGMQEAEKPSLDETIQLLIFCNEDMSEGIYDFSWIHSREFKYDGNFYDVVKKDENSGYLYIYCILDEMEIVLEEEFIKCLRKNYCESSQLSDSNKHNNLISEPVKSDQYNFTLNGQTIFYNLQAKHYRSFFNEIPSPPPRFV